jgi:hypothetical protein
MPIVKSRHSGFPATGQRTCHDVDGVEIECKYSGQDADFLTGLNCCEPIFIPDAE